MDDQQIADQAVERVVERGPEIVMKPVIEETKWRMELEQALISITRNR